MHVLDKLEPIENEWLMKKIAEEIIKERLGLPLNEQNISKLTQMLIDFEANAFTTFEQAVIDNGKKNANRWFVECNHPCFS